MIERCPRSVHTKIWVIPLDDGMVPRFFAYFNKDNPQEDTVMLWWSVFGNAGTCHCGYGKSGRNGRRSEFDIG